MYANILLSTDGSEVAAKGVKHGIALAKALNAKVTIISVTEPMYIDYGGGMPADISPRRRRSTASTPPRKSAQAKHSMKLEL